MKIRRFIKKLFRSKRDREIEEYRIAIAGLIYRNRILVEQNYLLQQIVESYQKETTLGQIGK